MQQTTYKQQWASQLQYEMSGKDTTYKPQISWRGAVHYNKFPSDIKNYNYKNYNFTWQQKITGPQRRQ